MTHHTPDTDSPSAAMDQRIDDFLTGSMSPSEAEAFRADTQTDAALRRRCRERLILLRGIQSAGHQRDGHTMATALHTTRQQVLRASGATHSDHTARPTRIISMFAVALSVAAIAVGAFFLLRTPAGDPTLQYALAHTSLVMETGGQGGVRAGQEDQSAHEAAMTELYQRVQQEQDQSLAQDTRLLQQHYDRAMNQTMGDDPCDEHPSQVAWYLVIAHLQAGNTDQARDIVRQCLQQGDYTFANDRERAAFQHLARLLDIEL